MSLITLVSGGIDSTLMSILAKEEGVEQYPLFLNYGQLSVNKEWETCRAIHVKYGLPLPVFMNLSGFGRLISCGLTDSRARVNEDAFLPGRNLLFILAGAGYAYHVGASGVAIGLLSEEYRIFPDQSNVFLRKCEDVLEVAIGTHIRVVAPLLEFSKQDILELAKVQGIEGTYSCHTGKDEPCGVCISCVEIKTTNKGRR